MRWALPGLALAIGIAMVLGVVLLLPDHDQNPAVAILAVFIGSIVTIYVFLATRTRTLSVRQWDAGPCPQCHMTGDHKLNCSWAYQGR